MEALFDWVQTHTNIPLEELEEFTKRLTPFEFQKNEFITNIGQVEKHIYFFTEGVAKNYLLKDDKEICFHFVFQNDFCSNYESFVEEKPSQYYFQALTKCKGYKISCKDIDELYHTTKSGNYLGRLILEKLFLESSKRFISMLSDSPRERYLTLLNQEPELLQKVSLKHIASYLGMTPETLSRIRHQIFQED